MNPRRRVALLAAYAVATSLSFPQLVGGHVIDLGALVAWAGPALLLLGVHGLPARRAAGCGFVAGLAAHVLIFHWIYVVTVRYGHAPVALGLLAPMAPAAYVAAFSALFAASAALFGRWSVASPFSLACVWTALDHLRSFALSGFPWATLGYAQHRNAALLALAPYTGVYGLSFATVLGAAALAGAGQALAARRRPAPGVWAALGVVALLHGSGLALTRGEAAGAASIRVGVVQGNIEQGVKWSPEWAERTLALYEGLSREAALQGARVIVWPETAVPGTLEERGEARDRLSRLAAETGASFVVGAVGIEVDPSQPGGLHFYDSAYLVDGAGAFGERYDKSHLVPFGEYVPLSAVLGRVLRAVARGIATTGITPGPRPRSLPLDLTGGERVRIGVPICYELVFPGLVRSFVRDGAEVLVAITNDAWYGRTGAPYQFLAITALRSAEAGVWTARAANTGVSAIIDAHGRVRVQTGIFERGLLVADVPLHPAPIGGSFYTRHGDAFAAACWAGAVLFGVAGRARRARREGRPDERDPVGGPGRPR